jgi:hypothetical protein
MLTRSLAALLTAAAALTATACTTTPAGDPPSPEAAAPVWSQYAPDPAVAEDTPARVAGPPRNERGNIEKALGQTGGYTDDATGALVIEFAATGIRESVCESWMDVPTDQQPITVELVVNTHDDPGNILPLLQFGSGWEYIAPDGTSINAAEYMGCETEWLQLRPNRKYTTTVGLRVPKGATGGQLVWNPGVMSGGYEWDLQL